MTLHALQLSFISHIILGAYTIDHYRKMLIRWHNPKGNFFQSDNQFSLEFSQQYNDSAKLKKFDKQLILIRAAEI